MDFKDGELGRRSLPGRRYGTWQDPADSGVYVEPKGQRGADGSGSSIRSGQLEDRGKSLHALA